MYHYKIYSSLKYILAQVRISRETLTQVQSDTRREKGKAGGLKEKFGHDSHDLELFSLCFPLFPDMAVAQS